MSRVMRIGIDARFYGTLGKGLGRYVSELVAQLETLDHENDYVVFLRKENFADYVPKNPRFSKALADVPWYSLAEQLSLPRIMRQHRLDLVHFPHFNVPFLCFLPFVVTVHDLILLSHPTPRATRLGPLLYRLKYLGYRIIMASALRRARVILTVSGFSADEIRRHFPFTAKRDIRVTYQSCSPAIAAPTAGQNARLKLPEPYFLYVGSAYPHKNLETLIAAFQDFRAAGHQDHHLVLVGKSDYFYDRLQSETTTRRRKQNVIFFGHATDAELTAIYDHAEAYVFPSLCEGFGLPPLEAMCRNVPVAAAHSSCLPEILNDAADWFDPKNQEDIARSLARISGDDQYRARLRERGTANVARFANGELGAKTLDAYRAALNAGKA